jgi:oligoendopeptidase F
MRRMSWVAVIPALALGCATGSSNEKPTSEAVKTQSQAQAALQRAADGQKRALEEQQKAEQLQQQVVQKQKDLADTQARLSAQRAKAQQAQSDAQRLSAEAQQEGQRQQTQAMQLQQQQVQTNQQQMQQNQQSFMKARNVSGQAVSATKDELLLRSSDQGDVRLKLNDSTSITVDGKMGTGEQIQPGEDVRATYQLIDGQSVAVKIDATSSKSGASSSETSQPKQ